MQGKQVLLTGGTGGLGLGVTPLVVRSGAKVTIPYRTEANVKRLKEVLSATEFESIRFVQVDMMQENAIAQLVAEMGRVDVLIHLVGGFAMGRVEEYSSDDWHKDFNLNVHTTFLACKYCLQKMRANGYGRIVTIGSRGAVQPTGQLGSYCATKAAVVALTKAIAEENKDMDITANSILPSVIDTPTNREAMGEDQADQWVKLQSIGEVVQLLASEQAREIRGAAIPVYGTM
ncbi:MAG: 3-oxoacyl-ACP reductase FabG [Kamptonema sp. SIO4C4]|nr:3-oxoacyl-ACP reductase FabG [Kamptonema sp. SIO4C4]